MEPKKVKEIKEEVLRIRLTKHYKQKLRAYAEKHGKSESQVIRDYIRRLPDQNKAI